MFTLLLSGCGLDAYGVLTLDFPLAPTPERPVGLDPAPFAAARGRLRIDGAAGRGELSTTGLPRPRGRGHYRVTLELAEDPRAGLTGSVPTTARPIGALVLTGESGALIFGASEVAPLPLGGCRRATITLVRSAATLTGTIAEDVLDGRLEDGGAESDRPPESEAAHVHGV